MDVDVDVGSRGMAVMTRRPALVFPMSERVRGRAGRLYCYRSLTQRLSMRRIQRRAISKDMVLSVAFVLLKTDLKRPS